MDEPLNTALDYIGLVGSLAYSLYLAGINYKLIEDAVPRQRRLQLDDLCERATWIDFSMQDKNGKGFGISS